MWHLWRTCWFLTTSAAPVDDAAQMGWVSGLPVCEEAGKVTSAERFVDRLHQRRAGTFHRDPPLPLLPLAEWP